MMRPTSPGKAGPPTRDLYPRAQLGQPNVSESSVLPDLGQLGPSWANRVSHMSSPCKGFVQAGPGGPVLSQTRAGPGSDLGARCCRTWADLGGPGPTWANLGQPGPTWAKLGQPSVPYELPLQRICPSWTWGPGSGPKGTRFGLTRSTAEGAGGFAVRDRSLSARHVLRRDANRRCRFSATIAP